MQEQEYITGSGTLSDKLELFNRMFELITQFELKKKEFKEDVKSLDDEFSSLIDKDTRFAIKKLADLDAKDKLFDFQTESNEIIELKNELDNVRRGV